MPDAVTPDELARLRRRVAALEEALRTIARPGTPGRRYDDLAYWRDVASAQQRLAADALRGETGGPHERH